MKRIYYIATLALALASALPVVAQEEQQGTEQQQRRRGPEMTRGGRAEEKADDSGLPELTVRARELNERMTQVLGNARWMRVIYREVDLTKEENAPLYYPTQPMNGQMNLFSTLFQLVCEGRINVYEYMDGYEDFSDNRILDLKVMLDRSRIYYEETPAEGDEPAGYVVNESDIPSADVKLLALCPILTIADEMGENTMPMFWVPYESIRPYIMNSYIMTSNINNAMTFTYDDYFRRRMFKGDIFKTQNLMNLPLQAYCPTPDSLQREQARIEKQLISFEESLYLKPDTTQQVADTKSSKKSRSEKAEESKEEKVKETKAAKPKKVKVQRSAPTRRVRR